LLSSTWHHLLFDLVHSGESEGAKARRTRAASFKVPERD
jgi:hypothetical protein